MHGGNTKIPSNSLTGEELDSAKGVSISTQVVSMCERILTVIPYPISCSRHRETLKQTSKLHAWSNESIFVNINFNVLAAIISYLLHFLLLFFSSFSFKYGIVTRYFNIVCYNIKSNVDSERITI